MSYNDFFDFVERFSPLSKRKRDKCPLCFGHKIQFLSQVRPINTFLFGLWSFFFAMLGILVYLLLDIEKTKKLLYEK